MGKGQDRGSAGKGNTGRVVDMGRKMVRGDYIAKDL